MRLFDRIRSLHLYVLLWLIVPFTVILTIALAAIIIAFRNNTTQLILERHQQLANLAAVAVSQGIEGNAHVLEALRDRAALTDPSIEVRETALLQSADALVDFTAGVVQLDADGAVITATPGTLLASWRGFSAWPFREDLAASHGPVFSDVIALQEGQDAILIAVPMFGEMGGISGAIVGGIDIHSQQNSISLAIRKLTTSTPGIAYLVDGRGIVISHPDSAEIGQDYSDQPLIGKASPGSHGGILWRSPQGERFVGAEAQVEPTGWRVVVREPWEAIVASSSRSTWIILAFILLAQAAFILLSWAGTRKVTAPIQRLSQNTRLLASGEPVPDIEQSQIQEIEDLRAAFTRMSEQIASYRDGLRHYVEAITRSQEDERLRIARELHDDTVQNLLAVNRRMELLSATESDPQKQQQLIALHGMIDQTLQGVRLISQDLRPMMLDDLGFVPAVQMLVRKAHEGQGAVPDVRLEVKGTPQPLTANAELALYRIVQEALNNVRKHAQATSVGVLIEYQDHSVDLTIRDDGGGFLVPASFTELVEAGHLGLMGIQERVWAAGGTLQVESRVGQGTEIRVSIPLG